MTPPLPPPTGAEPSFDERLKILLAQSGQTTLLAGHITIVGLHKVKARFGATWEKHAESADRIVRTTIERHLATGDIYATVHRVIYVIAFAGLTADEARFKCTIIADEIAKALVGAEGTNLLTVKTSVKAVDGSFSLESIKPTDGDGGAGGEQLEFVEEETAVPAKKAADSGRPPSLVRKERALANLRFAYRPMWDSARNVVSAYRCIALAASPDGAPPVDAGVIVGTDAVAIHRLDEAVRVQVFKDLEALLRDNCTLLLSLPVHFETFAALARRRQLVEALSKGLDDRGRKLLLVEIHGVPQGVPQARLVELLAPLRPQCRAIMLNLPIEIADFSNLKGCGALAIGCDITGHPGPEFMMMQQMNRFARAVADKTGLPSYLRGANSLSMVTAALGAGFAYIDGDAVAKLIDHPRGLVDFRLA
ncbi:MAG TPA: hypothetical protein VJO12_18405, partial [Stellaceae bacterium]|nr:hypothetical protein [Stellaceae bacterium]